MSQRQVVALGVGQCVSWGVLYYAFAVLAAPLARELGTAPWVVAGAFSVALLTSALAAPAVGRWCDGGAAPSVMLAGGIAASLLLAAWTTIPGLPALYAIWASLGLCMAAVLYEPAFAVIGGAYESRQARLQALALLTLLGGLASTVFLPAAAALAGAFGWRGAVRVLAATLALSTVHTHVTGLRRLPRPPAASAGVVSGGEPAVASDVRFGFIAAAFTLASLASTGFTANLVPALGARGLDVQQAALVGGAMGLMQLPGRAALLHGGLTAAPDRLLAIVLGLQALGFALLGLGTAAPMVWTGALAFALGAGLATLVRPHLVQSLYGGQAGTLNGRIARYQQLFRAAGPLTLAGAGGQLGYSSLFLVTAAVFALGAAASRRVLGAPEAIERKRPAMTDRTPRPDAAKVPSPACCQPVTLATCCGTESKATCCGPEPAPKTCGCGPTPGTAAVR